MISRTVRRTIGLGLAGTALATLASGCVVTVGSGEQPKTELTCPGHVVKVTLTNTSRVDHRYTVTVDVGHDGMHEDFLLSSELVRAGASADLKETVLTDDPITCTLKGIQAFAG